MCLGCNDSHRAHPNNLKICRSVPGAQMKRLQREGRALSVPEGPSEVKGGGDGEGGETRGG